MKNSETDNISKMKSSRRIQKEKLNWRIENKGGHKYDERLNNETRGSNECRQEKTMNKNERCDDKCKEDLMNTRVRSGRVFLRHG